MVLIISFPKEKKNSLLWWERNKVWVDNAHQKKDEEGNKERHLYNCLHLLNIEVRTPSRQPIVLSHLPLLG